MNGPTAAPGVPAFLAAEAERVERALAEVLDRAARGLARAARRPGPLRGGRGRQAVPADPVRRRVPRGQRGRAGRCGVPYCVRARADPRLLARPRRPPVHGRRELRRGRPTAHRVHGAAAAAVAGAAMIPLACRVLDAGAAELGLSDEERAEALRELCVAAGAAGLVGGQWLDLDAEGRDVTLPDLETRAPCQDGSAACRRLRARRARCPGRAGGDRCAGELRAVARPRLPDRRRPARCDRARGRPRQARRPGRGPRQGNVPRAARHRRGPGARHGGGGRRPSPHCAARGSGARSSRRSRASRWIGRDDGHAAAHGCAAAGRSPRVVVRTSTYRRCWFHS